ncbi:Ribosome biogenesis protein WDR12-like protein [Diplonema papillatum]|nr:Ribosome biogenesis protein WDR12-like protein [Diplonema papillatum]
MADTLAADVPRVIVSFFTNSFKKDVGESQTFTVPKTVTKHGLSDIVNKLLGHSDEGYVPFDFLYNDEFVTVSFDKFLKARPDVNTDDALALEYTPALSMEEGDEVPHEDWVSSISVPFFEQLEDPVVVSGCYDRRVRVWAGSELIAVGDGHKGAVKHVAAVSASGSDGGSRKRKRDVQPLIAVSGSMDGSIKLWKFNNAEGLRVTHTLSHHKDSVSSVGLTKNGDVGCSGSWDKTVSLWKMPTEGTTSTSQIETVELAGHSRPVLATKFSNDGYQVFSSGLDGQLKHWDVTRAAFIATYPGEYATYSIDVSTTDPNLLLTGHSDNRVRLWDIRQKKHTKTFSGHTGWVYSVRWCPEGAVGSHGFVSGAEDAKINLYDLRAQRPLAVHEVHTDGVFSLAFTSKSVVASGSKDTTIKTTTLHARDQKS